MAAGGRRRKGERGGGRRGRVHGHLANYLYTQRKQLFLYSAIANSLSVLGSKIFSVSLKDFSVSLFPWEDQNCKRFELVYKLQGRDCCSIPKPSENPCGRITLKSSKMVFLDAIP